MQITRHERRERLLHGITLREARSRSTAGQTPASGSHKKTTGLCFDESDPLPYTAPTAHHHISETMRNKENIVAWVSERTQDPAMEVSLNPNARCSYLFIPFRTLC